MMYRKIIFLAACLLTVTAVRADHSILSVGVRGGGACHVDFNASTLNLPSGAGMLDINFTKLWCTANQHDGFGIRTGINIGFAATNNRTGIIRDDFVKKDIPFYVVAEKKTVVTDIYYTTQTRGNETMRQLQVEVPLMFAMRKKHLTMGIGAKLMVPIWSEYQTQINTADTHITADIRQFGVTTTDELATGKMTDDAKGLSGRNCAPRLNVLFAFDIGYEWKLKNNRLIGLGAFLDFAPWSSYTSNRDKQHFIRIDFVPSTETYTPPARVSCQPLHEATMSRMLYLDFGVRFYYAFQHTDYKQIYKPLRLYRYRR